MALGWGRQEVHDLKEAVQEAARKYLNMKNSHRRQSKAALKKICDQMMEDKMWSRLKEYEKCWPVRGILKLALKHGSEASRRGATKAMVRWY